MSSPTPFRHRPHCGLCARTDPPVLRSVDYGDPRVRGFLERYYQGRVPVDALAGTPYEVAYCPGCRFAWQTQVPDEATLEMLYEHWTSATDSRRKKENASVALFSKYAGEVRTVSRLLGLRPHRIRVLDLGMGWGHWCRMARAFNYEAVGLELSARRVEYARRMGIHAVGSLEELDDPTFHFVNAEQVLEHVPDPGGLMETVAGVLRPGGVVRVSVPRGAAAIHRIRRDGWEARKDALHPLEHLNCFTGRSLRRLGEGAGLLRVRGAVPWSDLFSLGARLRYRDSHVEHFRKEGPG